MAVEKVSEKLYKMDVKTKLVSEKNADMVLSSYSNGQTLIRILSKSGEPLLTASASLKFPQREGEVFIKNWSENEGILECLIEQGVVEPPHCSLPAGFVEAKVCKLVVGE